MGNDEISEEIERKETLGVILTTLEDFDRNELLQLASKVVELGLAEPKSSFAECNDEALRDWLRDIAKELYFNRSYALFRVEQIIEHIELEGIKDAFQRKEISSG